MWRWGKCFSIPFSAICSIIIIHVWPGTATSLSIRSVRDRQAAVSFPRIIPWTRSVPSHFSLSIMSILENDFNSPDHCALSFLHSFLIFVQPGCSAIYFICIIQFFQMRSILLLPDFPSSIWINPGLYFAPFHKHCEKPRPNSTPVISILLRLVQSVAESTFCFFHFFTLFSGMGNYEGQESVFLKWKRKTAIWNDRPESLGWFYRLSSRSWARGLCSQVRPATRRLNTK